MLGLLTNRELNKRYRFYKLLLKRVERRGVLYAYAVEDVKCAIRDAEYVLAIRGIYVVYKFKH